MIQCYQDAKVYNLFNMLYIAVYDDVVLVEKQRKEKINKDLLRTNSNLIILDYFIMDY